MTDLNPSAGNAPAMPSPHPFRPRPIEELTTAEARIAALCEWFDVQPPPLRRRKGSITMTDAFLNWHVEEGVSLDWTICGDVRGMAMAYREAELRKKELTDAMRGLEDEELRLFNEALAEWKRKVEERRAAIKVATGDGKGEGLDD